MITSLDYAIVAAKCLRFRVSARASGTQDGVADVPEWLSLLLMPRMLLPILLKVVKMRLIVVFNEIDKLFLPPVSNVSLTPRIIHVFKYI